MPRILILGESGFIGSNIRRFISDNTEGVEVLLVKRNSSQLGSIKPNESIIEDNELHSISLDFIINCSAKRATSLNKYNDAEVREACFEWPKYLIEKMVDRGVNVINLSTYIQNFQGQRNFATEKYAEAKNELSNYLERAQNEGKLKHLDLYLFTIYGVGDKKDRLIPHIVDNIMAERVTELTPGRQLLDLMNVIDLSGKIVEIIQQRNLEVSGKFEFWSRNYITLRDLASEIEKACEKRGKLLWGARPYNGHEMLKPWSQVFPTYPNLSTQISLEEGLKDIVNARHQSV